MPDDLLIPDVAVTKHFDIITGALKAYEENGTRLLRGTASSTIVDLAGDRMAESALSDMERDAGDRMTVFLNHSYQVPEDVFGSITARNLTRRDAFVDFDVEMEVLTADENPRADQAYRAIRDKGVKLGISIGAQVLDAARVKEASAEGKEREIIEFRAVKLLEASIVGIPCNPRSWVANAVKSFTLKADGESEHDKAVDAQKHRQSVCHIAPKDGGHLTCPSEWASIADNESAWGDWTNFAYPMPDKEHADNAASRWGDASNRSGYSHEEQAVISRRIEERQRHFGESKEKSLDQITLTLGPDAVKGIIAVELAEAEFRRNMWRLFSVFEDVVWNQMSQEQGNPPAIASYIREAAAEFVTLLDQEVTRALAAGVAGPQDNDRTATSDDDDAMDALCEFVPALLKHEQLSGEDRVRLAAALGLTEPAGEPATAEPATKDADPETVKDALGEHQTLLDELATKRAEITRELDAAKALVGEHTTLLAGLDTQKRELEAEVADLEAARARELAQGTGRPTQKFANAAPLTVKDIMTMSPEEIAQRLREAAD